MFMPEIYPDELVYSWFARYYAHSGHPAYVSALGDLMEKKNTRPDVEFISRINKDAKDIIQKMMPMEEMVLGHTMFPYYRFAGNARISNALWAMSGNGGGCPPAPASVQREAWGAGKAYQILP